MKKIENMSKKVRKRIAEGTVVTLSLLTLLIAFGTTRTNAQSVGINNASPDASSIIDMTATDRGILIPRMTSAQVAAISISANGLLVFDTDEDRFYFNEGTSGTLTKMRGIYSWA